MLYLLLSFVIKLISYIPFSVLYIISNCLYTIVYNLFRYRRKLVRKNLIESFPQKSTKEIISIETKFYQHFCDLILETIKLYTISPKDIKLHMKFKNVEDIKVSQRSGKSIALFLGHYGNWEWISSLPIWLDSNIIGAQIYHELHNKTLDQLMLTIRGRMGSSNIEMRKTARFMNTQANFGNVCTIGFIADQSPTKKDAKHFLHFLNHTTPVLVGTEKIIKRYDYEPWFVKVTRKKRGFYEAEFIKMHENAQNLDDYKLTSIYYDLLEEMICMCPELYLWAHNRFKHAKYNT